MTAAATSLLLPGQRAPEFALRNQHNQLVTLGDYRGKSLLVVFFPLAFTGNCEGELGEIRDAIDDFETTSRAVACISVGPPPTHKVWAAAQGYLFPLLSDFWPHGEVARSYGVFNDRKGYANRGTFVVNPGGDIAFSEMKAPGEMRDQQLWRRALDVLDGA